MSNKTEGLHGAVPSLYSVSDYGEMLAVELKPGNTI